MGKIATYVFVDIETTGKSEEMKETRKTDLETSITELSMLVVKRSHMSEPRVEYLPRVISKLTICFNPDKEMSPRGSGLNNELLQNETKFNKTVTTINGFLEFLEKPVCLIAHCGFEFDFPILKKHFAKSNSSLADDIMCTDSIYAFYDILELNWTPVASGAGDIFQDESSVEKVSENDENDVRSQHSNRIQNDSTPKRRKLNPTSPKTFSQIKRNIFFDGNPSPGKGRYTLLNIYKRVVDEYATEAHQAEIDCIMIAKIAVANAEMFVEWVDDHHCAFNEIEPIAAPPAVRKLNL